MGTRTFVTDLREVSDNHTGEENVLKNDLESTLSRKQINHCQAGEAAEAAEAAEAGPKSSSLLSLLSPLSKPTA